MLTALRLWEMYRRKKRFAGGAAGCLATNHFEANTCLVTKKGLYRTMAAFCAARGVTYHEASLVDGTVEVLKHLKDIAEEFVSEFPAM